MKRIIHILACFSLMTAAILTAGCAAKPEPAGLFSEGEDTPVTITGYTDLSGSNDSYFLKEGDKIAVIAPSALPGREKVETVMNGLRECGYVPVEGKYASVEERTLENCIEDLEWALTDPEIKGIFCVRGGYASTEVMDVLPLSLIKDAKKPIIGFSDITVYLSAWTASGLMSLHSEMYYLFNGLSEECVDPSKRILQGEIPVYHVEGTDSDIPGQAEGILIGGNLVTLTSVLNTAYDCTRTGQPYILFLEEVAEDYEHIHRGLTILDHFGVLDNAQGIIFGEWIEVPEECETYGGSSRGGAFQSVRDMISRQFLQDCKIPVAFGFPSGHGTVNYPLLMGAPMRLNVTEDSYTLEWLAEDSQKNK